MERKSYFLMGIFIFLVSLVNTTTAQGHNTDSTLYAAYINSSIAQWERIATHPIPHAEKQLNVYYGYTAWLLSIDNDDEADAFIEKSEKIIEKLLAKNPKNATAYAYRGAFMGYEIGSSPYKAISLGPKSNEAIAYSLELDSNNIQGHIEKGNAAYYTPSFFGGSKTVAVQSYTKAIALLEAQKLTDNNWLYLNVLTMLAQAQQRTNRIPEANATYQKILRLEPNFKWVRDELYPEFKKEYLSIN